LWRQESQIGAPEARCAILRRRVTCHSLDYIEMNAPVMSRTSWQETIRKMIDRFGAPISDDEAREIPGYLSAQYSSGP
jgi:hypothetical protein